MQKTRNEAPYGWYESSLSGSERKQRGHFSTPLALVDQILDACGYRSEADLRSLRVLDPACGSGNFLSRAALRLCLSAQAHGEDAAHSARLVQRNLWGLDPDPVACFLAESQVTGAVTSCLPDPTLQFQPHIHQADALVLPWQPRVDLLIANPPYLATKNTDLSSYVSVRQRRGQVDSYLLFLDLALQVVRPGGWIGLILPDPVLARANATLERIHLLDTCTLHHLWHLSNVFAAEVGAVVFIAQKMPASSEHLISWTRSRWSDNKRERPLATLAKGGGQSQQISQNLLLNQPNSALRYLLNTPQGYCVEQLRQALEQSKSTLNERRGLMYLEQLVYIMRGEEIGRNAVYDTTVDGLPVLRGGIDVHPYASPISAWRMPQSSVKKLLANYLRPKLLVVKSTERLQAVLDTQGHIVLQTLYLLHVRRPDLDLETSYYLLALLNSRLLRDYIYYLTTAYKLVQPQIDLAALAHLPIAWGYPRQQLEIATRAREIERACTRAGYGIEWDQRMADYYEEQEQAIYALYARIVPSLLRNQDHKGVSCYGENAPNSGLSCQTWSGRA